MLWLASRVTPWGVYATCHQFIVAYTPLELKQLTRGALASQGDPRHAAPLLVAAYNAAALTKVMEYLTLSPTNTPLLLWMRCLQRQPCHHKGGHCCHVGCAPPCGPPGRLLSERHRG